MGMDPGVFSDTLTESPVEQPQETAVESPQLETERIEGIEPVSEQVAQPEGGEVAEQQEPTEPARTKEVLPRELAKALRELREAHPAHAESLKALDKAFYRNREYTSTFPTPEEARTAKSTLEALGGPEGITRMRQEIQSFRDLDSLASQGDPRTIQALAEEFPEGFKRLVPAALERLSNMDRQAYAEAMRGPLLQMLEGDGLIQAIGAAIEELKAGNADRANRELNSIAGWYQKLKQTETEYRNRYQDPRLQELERREQQVRSEQSNLMRNHFGREITSYLSSSLDPLLRQMTNGMKLSSEGLADLKESVTSAVAKNLRANSFYRDTVNDLLAQGDIDKVIDFAKPHIDQARKAELPRVWQRRYGTLPGQRRVAAAENAGTNQPPPQVRGAVKASNNQPIPVPRQPGVDELDMSKDPTYVNFIAGRGWLKNGKFVVWKR